MKDIFNNELEVGDEVAFTEPGYTYTLVTGTIIKFTPQKMVVEWVGASTRGSRTMLTYKFPEQVAKNCRNNRCPGD